MTIQTDSSKDQRSLWLGALAGPITWSVYFMIGYLLVEIVCKSDFLGFNLLGMQAVSVIILILTLVGMAITVYAGFVDYRKWQQGSEERSLDFGEQLSDQPVRFMALSGFLLNGLFTLTILLTGVAVFILRPC